VAVAEHREGHGKAEQEEADEVAHERFLLLDDTMPPIRAFARRSAREFADGRTPIRAGVGRRAGI